MADVPFPSWIHVPFVGPWVDAPALILMNLLRHITMPRSRHPPAPYNHDALQQYFSEGAAAGPGPTVLTPAALNTIYSIALPAYLSTDRAEQIRRHTNLLAMLFRKYAEKVVLSETDGPRNRVVEKAVDLLLGRDRSQPDRESDAEASLEDEPPSLRLTRHHPATTTTTTTKGKEKCPNHLPSGIGIGVGIGARDGHDVGMPDACLDAAQGSARHEENANNNNNNSITDNPAAAAVHQDFAALQAYRARLEAHKYAIDAKAQRLANAQAELKRAVAENNTKHQQLEKDAASRHQQLENLERTMADRAWKISHYDGIIDDKEKNVARLHNRIAAEQEAVAELALEMTKKKTQISESDTQVAKKQARIDELNIEMGQKENRLEELGIEIGHKQKRMSGLEVGMVEKERMIYKLHSEMEQKQKKMSELDMAMVQKERMLAKIDLEMGQGEKKTNKLEQATLPSSFVPQNILHRCEKILSLTSSAASIQKRRLAQELSQAAKNMPLDLIQPKLTRIRDLLDQRYPVPALLAMRQVVGLVVAAVEQVGENGGGEVEDMDVV